MDSVRCAADDACAAAACGGARTHVAMGPLPLTLVTVLRRRRARLSSEAASRKADESWTKQGLHMDGVIGVEEVYAD